MAKIEFRNAYSDPLDIGIDCSVSPSLTKQSFHDECDINNIVNRGIRDGILTHLNEGTAQYVDVTQYLSYQESLNVVIAAQNAFNELPAEIRYEFANDPARYVDFCSNPKNLPRMIELGLALPPKETYPQPDTALSNGAEGGGVVHKSSDSITAPASPS